MLKESKMLNTEVRNLALVCEFVINTPAETELTQRWKMQVCPRNSYVHSRENIPKEKILHV